MKIFKKILAVLLVIILFVGSFGGSYHLFNNGTFEFDTEYLSVFDESQDTFYLKKVAKDIIFKIDADPNAKETKYTLTDSKGKKVETKTQEFLTKGYNILPPDNGYTEGERYTLTLQKNAKFNDDSLKKARVLVFSIDRKEVASYEFTDSVKETDKTIEELSETKIRVNENLELGDIIFGLNKEKDHVAYKIIKINDDGTAEVEAPALDEIYSELDLYGTDVWDVEKIATNPEINAEVVENVRNSDFFDSLMVTAYADENPTDVAIKCKFNPDKPNKTLEAEISIELAPGKKGLFGISKLKNQKVTITLSSFIKLKTVYNIKLKDLKNFDVSATLTNTFSWSVDISLYTKEWENDKDLKKIFSEKNKITDFVKSKKQISDVIEKLASVKGDLTRGEIKLFDWELPLPSIPGLKFDAEVKLFGELEMSADITVGQEVTTATTVGISFINKKFETYTNKWRSTDGIELSLSGKANAKVGLKVEIGVEFIDDDIAFLQIDPQVGFYADLFVTFPVAGRSQINDDNFIYSYFEPGVYFSADVSAYVNLVFKSYSFSRELVEEKFPFEHLTFGNKKIAIKLEPSVPTVRAANYTVKAPDIMFEYYDVTKGIICTEAIPFKDLKFVDNNGTKLTVKNGKIKLPEASESGTIYITATYIHTDRRSYTTMFKVLLSGSVIEGKVSAYSEDLSTGTLAGATVKIYKGNDASTLISTDTTDENGKFSFNVSAGVYTLAISADGYKTLTSTQSVEEDEIKYTEHILLMDDSQTGNGTAGGKVTDALNGKGINGVKLKLRKNWNNTSGAYFESFETVTDSSGNYTVTDVPVGYYTVEASAEGYVKGYSNIIVLSESAAEDFDFTITPYLSENEIRIVLTWGSTPRDLDSHLIGKSPDGDAFNVYYSRKTYNYNGTEMANLDVDDTSSYGPETITILENIHDKYTYAVHDYTNKSSTSSKALSLSGATVKVFKGSYQVAKYNVPVDQVGTYWAVFQIDASGKIYPMNYLSNTKPVA